LQSKLNIRKFKWRLRNVMINWRKRNKNFKIKEINHFNWRRVCKNIKIRKLKLSNFMKGRLMGLNVFSNSLNTKSVISLEMLSLNFEQMYIKSRKIH
jgi:hypothetical protein